MLELIRKTRFFATAYFDATVSWDLCISAETPGSGRLSDLVLQGAESGALTNLELLYEQIQNENQNNVAACRGLAVSVFIGGCRPDTGDNPKRVLRPNESSDSVIYDADEEKRP